MREKTKDNIIYSDVLNKYKTIIWDFDGVIKESLEIKANTFIEVLNVKNEKKITKIKNHHYQNGGMSRFEKIPLYLKFLDKKVNDKQIEFLLKLFSQKVIDNVVNSDWVYGVEKYLLTNYKKKNFILLTATPEFEIKIILERLKLNKCFTKVFGSPINKSSKIKELLLDEINLIDILFIGDAKIDYEAATQNNIPFLLKCNKFNVKLQSKCELKFSCIHNG